MRIRIRTITKEDNIWDKYKNRDTQSNDCGDKYNYCNNLWFFGIGICSIIRYNNLSFAAKWIKMSPKPLKFKGSRAL
jgi:hypothetical protein